MPVRLAQQEDVSGIAELAARLWPEGSVEEHASEFMALLASGRTGTLPAVVFLAEGKDEGIVGFVQVGLRSHADGCDPSRPVGFLEGWYVLPSFRRKRVGAALVAAAEKWARSLGCVEMASDTWLAETASQQAHEALGYEVVDRCVHYRKEL